MALGSLAMTLADYRTAAIAEIGYGATDYDDLDVGEKAEIDRLIKRGERTFWVHPPGVSQPHAWSCLRDPGLLDLWSDVAVDAAVTVSGGAYSGGVTVLTATGGTPFYETMIGKSIVVTTVGTFTISAYTSSTVITVTGDASAASADTFSIAADGIYRLPSDFESPDTATMRFVSESWVPDVQLCDERIVTSLRATQSQTGYPQYAYIRWGDSDGTAAHYQELVVWPEPDQYYQVALPYTVQAQAMGASTDAPRGGAEMHDCLLSVILAVCEEAKNQQRGDRWAEAAEKCSAAARRDRSRHHNFVAGWMRPDAGASVQVFDVKRLVLPA